MKKFTVGSYFSGGGIGLATIKDRVDIAFGVEYDPAIAEVYKTNISDRIIVGRVQDVDVKKLERVDLFQVSPVCKEFSNAKVNGKESAEEMGQAAAICAYLDYHKPPFFVLENVRGYIKSKSFSMIVVKLSRLGYQMRYSVENSANFGVPQTRERLILRASLNGSVPVLSGYVSQWVGWYEAIEDLIPGLPESKFADWQLERLPEEYSTFLTDARNARTFEGGGVTAVGIEQPCFTVVSSAGPGRYRAFLADMFNASREFTVREENDPAFTITSTHMRRNSTIPKAVLIPGDNGSNETIRYEDEPMVTVRARSTGQCPARAFIVEGQTGDNGRFLAIPNSKEPVYTVSASMDKRPARAWLQQGRVVQMTPRALARFQSIPDWYELPQKNGLACTVIGNGVPSLMGEKIIASTLGLNEVKTELIA